MVTVKYRGEFPALNFYRQQSLKRRSLSIHVFRHFLTVSSLGTYIPTPTFFASDLLTCQFSWNQIKGVKGASDHGQDQRTNILSEQQRCS